MRKEKEKKDHVIPQKSTYSLSHKILDMKEIVGGMT
jgi:hypothetical protein